MSEAKAAQAYAADPVGSAWVAANAGSGKTRVLTERVARLLLAGARPEKILCLTYTKTAAAEMQNRLFAMLGGWAMLEDDALRRELGALADAATPAPLSADDLAAARRLFAEALETPGGLKIQTIHAFCDSLLRRFPMEAGAPPGFQVMDDRGRADMIAQVIEDMASADGPVRDAVAGLAARLDEVALTEMTRAVLSARDLFPTRVDEGAICAAFGVSDPPDPERERAQALTRLDRAALDAMIAAWAAGTEKEALKAVALSEAKASAAPEALAEALIAACLTADAAPLKRPATKAAKAAEPDWEAHFDHLAETALAIREAGLAASAAAAALDLARFGAQATTRYEAAKAARVVLDYDDLILRARDLLTRSEARDWVLYRLDGGVDHVLVDEAQDTSPGQWDVVEAIVGEFHAGAGARDVARTSFVVGDEKQSIYSFQGAAPGMFEEMRRRFADGLAPHGGLREAELAFSFRSAPAILRAVDATFGDERAAGLTARGAATAHRAFHGARAGRVELWPALAPVDAAEDPEPWAPVDMPGKDEPRVRLAGVVADRIAALTREGRLPGGGRRIAPGDVLVLLRNRAPMMRPLINGLKARGVPVAGADRLALLDELAVKDLLALMRFAATPEDDLTLAALLRSPLCGLSEDALFDLAHGREGSLWRAALEKNALPPEILSRLVEARRDADFLRPYEFLEKAVAADDGWGRRALLSRLGREADDPIDELLAEALRFEAEQVPSFDGFLSWMRADEADVKREPDAARDEVRVMSVHGAKGLEAPVVILPDTMRPPDEGRRDRIVPIQTPAGLRAAWKTAKDREPAAIRKARAERDEAALGEHKRLLYVAMTRAEDLLIVAGAGDPGKAKGSWYSMVAAGFDAAPHLVEDLPPGLLGDGVLEAKVIEDAGAAKTDEAARGAPALEPRERPWLHRPVAPGPKAIRVRAASDLSAGAVRAGGRFAPEIARLRGEAIHAALEVGGDRAAAEEAMRRAVFAFPLAPELAEGALAEALAVRAAPEAAPFFAPNAVAEAAISVMIGDVRVSGRIDRLIVEPDRVAFVDFKSDDAPPEAGASAPPGYLAQLGAYRAALSGIYPDRRVEAFILWTKTARLDRLSDDDMSAALAATKLSPEGEDELA